MEATCRLPKLWQPAVDILTRFDDYLQDNAEDEDDVDKSQLLLLGKFEYTGGPIFKVVLEC